MRPPRPHRATTANLQAAYPFVSDGSMATAGTLIGRDLFGGPFCFDPWRLYQTGRITNPNLLVLGQLGRGKSSFVKALVWRQVAFGRQAWVVDPKGEYGALAAACGSTPIALSPGGAARLNPLDAPAGEAGDDPVRTRSALAASLLASSLGRPLRPDERTALEIAVRAASSRASTPVLSDLVRALLHPDPGAAAEVGTDAAGLATAGRPAALELRRMVQGDLAGMFDGPTTAGLSLRSTVVVLDLSAAFASAALPLIMTCTTAWLQAALAAADGVKRLVVIDEAWAILSDLATARWSQATFKLSRSLGVSNVVVAHRLSDLRAAGADGSAEEKLAAGLLADSETRVVFGQPPSEAESTGRLLGLSAAEVDLVSRLPRGMALWRVGGRSFLVQHLLGAEEGRLVDTDAAMRP
jgi:type IV secretory pathway VirB4 component